MRINKKYNDSSFVSFEELYISNKDYTFDTLTQNRLPTVSFKVMCELSTLLASRFLFIKIVSKDFLGKRSVRFFLYYQSTSQSMI